MALLSLTLYAKKPTVDDTITAKIASLKNVTIENVDESDRAQLHPDGTISFARIGDPYLHKKGIWKVKDGKLTIKYMTAHPRIVTLPVAVIKDQLWVDENLSTDNVFITNIPE